MKAAGCDAPTGLTNVPILFVTVQLETYSQIPMKVILTTFIDYSNFLLCLESPWRHCLLQSSCMLSWRQSAISWRKMPIISPSHWTLFFFFDMPAFTAYFAFRLFVYGFVSNEHSGQIVQNSILSGSTLSNAIGWNETLLFFVDFRTDMPRVGL